jgi:hypothetical protein
MSEILTIDTTAGIQTTERIDPLPLFGEHYPMLLTVIPEYALGFPGNIGKTIEDDHEVIWWCWTICQSMWRIGKNVCHRYR